MNHSFKIETPKSLAQMVAARLREAIISGELALGEMIAEETLAASFGVSRTPVREALNQLQIQGLVTIRPQRGSYVFEPSAEDVAAIRDFRLMLEVTAAELSYQHDRAGTLQSMDQAIAAMEAAVAAQDAKRYGLADTQLHEAGFQHCGNPYLQNAYQQVAGKVAALRTNLTAPIDILGRRSFEQHVRFRTLFAEGDFAAFEALMRVHVGDTCDVYLRALQARQPAQPARV